LLTPHGLFPLGPLLAALIVLPFLGGWSAVVGFLRRIGQWRVGLLKGYHHFDTITYTI
jgi:hypothetical protein